MDLKGEDYIVLASVILVSLVVGLIDSSVTDIAHEYIELAGPVILLLCGYFTYKSSRSWQKSIARYLELNVIGIVFFATAWTFNILRTDFNISSALGQSSEFWLAFFHPFAVGSVIIIVYSTYLVWKEGRFEFEHV